MGCDDQVCHACLLLAPLLTAAGQEGDTGRPKFRRLPLRQLKPQQSSVHAAMRSATDPLDTEDSEPPRDEAAKICRPRKVQEPSIVRFVVDCCLREPTAEKTCYMAPVAHMRRRSDKCRTAAAYTRDFPHHSPRIEEMLQHVAACDTIKG